MNTKLLEKPTTTSLFNDLFEAMNGNQTVTTDLGRVSLTTGKAPSIRIDTGKNLVDLSKNADGTLLPLLVTDFIDAPHDDERDRIATGQREFMEIPEDLSFLSSIATQIRSRNQDSVN